MPELPEVETVRRVLDKSITGLTIVDIKIKYPNIIDGNTELFKSNIIGRKIVGVGRCGKHLIFNLDKGSIVSHLRMEGKYFYIPKDSLDNKHIHVIYYLDNGYMLAYQDVRKFGRMTYKEASELYTTSPLCEVGVDPVISSGNIDEIYNRIIKRGTPIKTTLLDQSIITGLGNIYVDEVLFMAKINPHRPSNKVSLDDIKNIMKYSHDIMTKAIDCGGTTIRSYTSSLGVEGGYQDYLLVHTKDICPVCKKSIIYDKTNGRGTYYCPCCQKF